MLGKAWSVSHSSAYRYIRLPHKKPKGGELTAEQKQENRELAKERVVGENAFSGVKRYRAVSDIYRNRVANFDAQLILTAYGIFMGAAA
jgi:hypothetical protein